MGKPSRGGRQFFTVLEIAAYAGCTSRMIQYLMRVHNIFPDAEKAGEAINSQWIVPNTPENRKTIEELRKKYGQS